MGLFFITTYYCSADGNRQPVKGRKKHGGIRLGEMERDALLSHGVAFCLQDRSYLESKKLDVSNVTVMCTG